MICTLIDSGKSANQIARLHYCMFRIQLLHTRQITEECRPDGAWACPVSIEADLPSVEEFITMSEKIVVG